jgi:hypothetical protein
MPGRNEVTFPTLERVDIPNGAQAAATQVMATFRVPLPQGVRAQRISLPTVSAPHKDAAMWFKQIHAGFLCAHFVSFAQNESELRHLFASESTELQAAAKWNPASPTGFGGTIRPRSLSVWLQLQTTVAQSQSGESMLDAMAHWATYVTPKGHKLASVVRMHVVAGTDAALLMKRADARAVRKVAATPNWAWRVTVCWVDGKGVERAETQQYETLPVSTDAMLAAIQQSVVCLCGAHDAPIHVATMVPITKRVPADAFCNLSVAMHNEFETHVTKPSVVVLDSAAAHPSSAPLENTGVVVRLAERQLLERGLTDSTAFHGVLLSLSSFTDDAVAFAVAAAHSPEGYLGAPVGQQEAAMALHVCATQAEKKDISPFVTLYGPIGRCGEPIRERGFPAWVWVESAAIRPIDADLLRNFCLYPCDKTSIMPRNEAFHEAYRAHFKRASELYVDLEKHKQPLVVSGQSSGSDTEDTDWLPPAETVELSKEDKAAQQYVLAALRVGMDSERTTIGEACAYLMEQGTASKVVSMFISTAGRIGIRASLASAVDLCRDAVSTLNNGPQIQAENASLKRLIGVALEARATELEESSVHSKRPRPINVQSNERVRRLLKALNLKAGVAKALHNPRRPADVRSVSELLRTLLGVQRSPNAADSAIKQIELATKEQLAQSVLDGACKAIDVILRYNEQNLKEAWTNVYILTSTSGEHGWVSVNQMANVYPGIGELLASSFDKLMGAENPKVLLINFLDDGHVRFTATTEISTN